MLLLASFILFYVRRANGLITKTALLLETMRPRTGKNGRGVRSSPRPLASSCINHKNVFLTPLTQIQVVRIF